MLKYIFMSLLVAVIVTSAFLQSKMEPFETKKIMVADVRECAANAQNSSGAYACMMDKVGKQPVDDYADLASATADDLKVTAETKPQYISGTFDTTWYYVNNEAARVEYKKYYKKTKHLRRWKSKRNIFRRIVSRFIPQAQGKRLLDKPTFLRKYYGERGIYNGDVARVIGWDFDGKWHDKGYLNIHPDVKNAGMTGADHYKRHGWNEDRVIELRVL